MRPGPVFLSNRAGGILGGVSTGETIVARFALKPTSSIPRAPAHDRYGRRGGRRGDQGAARPLRGDPRRPGGRGDGRACSRRPPAAPARPSRAPRAGGVRDGAMGGMAGIAASGMMEGPLPRFEIARAEAQDLPDLLRPRSCHLRPLLPGPQRSPPTPGTCACASPSISTLRPASRPSSPARARWGVPAAAPIAVGYAPLRPAPSGPRSANLAVLLKEIFVLEAHRNRGIGLALICARSAREAQSAECRRIVWTVGIAPTARPSASTRRLPGGARPVQAHAHHRRGRLRPASPPGRRLCARPCAGPGCAR